MTAGVGSFSNFPPTTSVYIETARGSDVFALAPQIVDWSSIKRELDGADDTASILVSVLDASKRTAPASIGSEHLRDVLDLLHPDRRVRIALTPGKDPATFLFQGYPVSTSPSWSPGHQSVTCMCVSEGQMRLRSTPGAQVMGRMMRYSPGRAWNPAEPDLVEVQTLAAVFNPDGKPNMLPERLETTIDRASHILFAFDEDENPSAAYWNFADAIRYVAAHYVNQTGVSIEALMLDTAALVGLVGTTPGDSGDPFLARMTARVEGVSIQSMNPEEALVALCKKAGLHLHLAITVAGEGVNAKPAWAVRIFAVLEKESDESATRERRMGSPKVRDIQRDAPFTNYAALELTPGDIKNRNLAQNAQLTFDRRAYNRVVILGGAREFQVTMLLRPGWLPNPDLDLVIVGPPAINKIDFWEDAYGYEDTVGETEDKEYHSLYHPKHPDFAAVADVLRKWVFPDDESYMNEDGVTSPYAKDREAPWDQPLLYGPFDSSFEHLIYAERDVGASIPIDEVREWIPRRRPFLPTIQRYDRASSSKTPVVWLNFSATDPFSALRDPHWVRFTGGVRFDPTRAAIYFTDDNLYASPAMRSVPQDPNTGMIPAYLGMNEDGSFGAPHFFVAVTCTVRGDRRLSHAVSMSGAFTSERAKVIDLGFSRFTSRRVIDQGHGKLRLASAGETDPEYMPRDDSAALTAYANRVGLDVSRESISGSWEADHIRTDVELGDSFAGVPGLGMEFDNYPEVKAIEWTKGPKEGLRTVYHLTDLRHAPDLGAE